MVRTINIDTKARTIRVSNGKDDLDWFTTDTGSHVPLKKGQSKSEAIKEHFGDKKTKQQPAKKEKPDTSNADYFKSTMQETMKKFPRLYEHEQKHLEEYAVSAFSALRNNPGKEKEIVDEILDSYNQHVKRLGMWVDTPTLAKKAFVEKLAKDLSEQPAKKETKSEDPRKSEAKSSDNFRALFEKYVPDKGKADTLFGEMMRAAGRIRDRYYRYGDMYGYGYGKTTVNNALSYLSKLAGGRGTELKKELDQALRQATTAAADYDEAEYERQVDRIVDAFANANWDDVKKLASIKNKTDSLTEYPDDTSYDDYVEDEEW